MMDVRILIPRVRRAIDGPMASSSAAVSATLNDDEVKNLVADAIAEVIFYSAGAWGRTLSVTERNAQDIPIEYAVDPDLDLSEQTVVVAQAALSYFFREFIDKKTQETITNEGGTWNYQLSANLLAEQMKMLVRARDTALGLIGQTDHTLSVYHSFLAVRDATVAAVIEPFITPGGTPGGQEIDWRFL